MMRYLITLLFPLWLIATGSYHTFNMDQNSVTTMISTVDIVPAVQNESITLQSRVTFDWLSTPNRSWRIGAALTNRGEIFTHPDAALEDSSSKMVFLGVAGHRFWENFGITVALNGGLNVIDSIDSDGKEYLSYYGELEGEMRFYLRFGEHFSIYLLGVAGVNQMISTEEPEVFADRISRERQERGFKVGGGVGVALLF